MNTCLTAAEMRATEEDAIRRGSVTGLTLMERAGQGLVDVLLAEWPELQDGVHRAIIGCGPGNNGGDGFVIARALHEKGWDVSVFLYGDAERLPPDARTNYEKWSALGRVLPLDEAGLPIEPGVTLIVDAFFGTGLSRPFHRGVAPDAEGVTHPEKRIGRALRDMCDCLAGRGMPLAERVRAGHPLVVAVDLPSGIDADTGEVLVPENAGTAAGRRAWAAEEDLTVTFHSEKCGHRLAAGPKHCGKVVVVDIGLTSEKEG